MNGKAMFPAGMESDTAVPGILLCHGFGGNMRAFESSARILTKRGFATFVFDFRGHGGSEGILEDKFPDDVVAAYNTFRNMPGVDKNRMAIVGHSLGAMSAIIASGQVENPRALVALSCPPQIDSTVFPDMKGFGEWSSVRNPVMDLPREGSHPWLSGLAAFICRIYMYVKGDRVRVNIPLFYRGASQMKIRDVVSRLENFPKLFVFCEGDIVTPWSRTAPVYNAALEPKMLHMHKGGNHTTPLGRNSVRNQWINWLSATLTAAR
jgi:pimeloyl-ACP methyl ester carboxylesterase